MVTPFCTFRLRSGQSNFATYDLHDLNLANILFRNKNMARKAKVITGIDLNLSRVQTMLLRTALRTLVRFTFQIVWFLVELYEKHNRSLLLNTCSLKV